MRTDQESQEIRKSIQLFETTWARSGPLPSYPLHTLTH